MKRAHIYKAEDGETFGTAEKCQAHEHEMFVGRLCGLTEAQVSAALARIRTPSDLALAADLERAGNIIAAQRRADGDMKRRKTKTDAEKLAAVGAALRDASK